MDVAYQPFVILYVGGIVLFGAWFSINIILAVMMQAFKKVQQKELLLEEQEITKKEEKLKKTKALKFLKRLK